METVRYINLAIIVFKNETLLYTERLIQFNINIIIIAYMMYDISTISNNYNKLLLTVATDVIKLQILKGMKLQSNFPLGYLYILTI